MPTGALKRMRPLDLTQAEVHRLFELRGGELYWKVKPRLSVNAGGLAGGRSRSGYWVIGIYGRLYKRSRLIWLYVHGADTHPLCLDHINRDRSDDRAENLRPVTHSDNQRNMRAKGESGHKFVYRAGRKLDVWIAKVPQSKPGVKSRHTIIGRFLTQPEAVAAVQEWERGSKLTEG